MKQEGILTFWTALLMSIGSFIFCIDIAIAIAYVVISQKHERSIAQKSIDS